MGRGFNIVVKAIFGTLALFSLILLLILYPTYNFNPPQSQWGVGLAAVLLFVFGGLFFLALVELNESGEDDTSGWKGTSRQGVHEVQSGSEKWRKYA